MNTQAVEAQIAQIIANKHSRMTGKQIRQQYPVGKAQSAKLTELGIIDLMPSGFGFSDADAVIAEATSGVSGHVTAYGEGEDGPASTLYTLLHSPEPTPELAFDPSGRVRWHSVAKDGQRELLLPEPRISATDIRAFILASTEAGAGYDIGEHSDAAAWHYSVIDAAVAALAAAQPPAPMISDTILNEMPWHLGTLEEIFAALSPEQLAIFEREGQVWASSKGYLPSMNPEGENVSFILVEGVIIGRYRKSVRFGQDISFEAPLGETIPVREGRVAMEQRLAAARTKMIEAALARAKAKFAE